VQQRLSSQPSLRFCYKVSTKPVSEDEHLQGLAAAKALLLQP
jgi:hypothetical protein